MTIFHEYMRLKTELEVKERQKIEGMRNRSNQELIKRTTTIHNETPNMKEAYSSVVNSGYKPSPEEIHYRRFTSGSYVDSNDK